MVHMATLLWMVLLGIDACNTLGAAQVIDQCASTAVAIAGQL